MCVHIIYNIHTQSEQEKKLFLLVAKIGVNTSDTLKHCDDITLRCKQDLDVELQKENTVVEVMLQSCIKSTQQF